MEPAIPCEFPRCEEDWEAQRETITDLYIRKGETLRDVRLIMTKKHNFRASDKQFKIRFSKWELSKNFKGKDAEQITNGVKPVRRRVRPESSLEETREKAARSWKRKQARERQSIDQLPSQPSQSAEGSIAISDSQQQHVLPPVGPTAWSHSSPQAHNALVKQWSSNHMNATPLLVKPSMEVDEKFLFDLRNYTHEACVFGHWNPEALAKHYRGRQASRVLSSELTAGTKLFENGKQKQAELHWDRALKSLQNPDLFTTWYHETPLRLLFEIGRIAYLGHDHLASSLIQAVKTHAHTFLTRKDPRHALFTVFGELPVAQLRDLYERAALSLRKGLESRVDKHNPLLYEIRLNRALDLLWFDARTDLKKWLPPVEEVDQALGPDHPYIVYFLLLEAYRLVAAGQYADAEQVCSNVSSRIEVLKENPGKIDPWKIALAYRRLGRQQYEQERYDDARRTFNKALMYMDKKKPSVLVEIYQYQERLARLAEDQEDVRFWAFKLQQLEEDTMEEEQEDLRKASTVSLELPDLIPMTTGYQINDANASTAMPTTIPMTYHFNPTAYSSANDHAMLGHNVSVPLDADMSTTFSSYTNEPNSMYFEDQMAVLDVPFYSPNDISYTNGGSIIPMNTVHDTTMVSENQQWVNLSAAKSPRRETL